MHYQAIALVAAAAATQVAGAPQPQPTANVLGPFLPENFPTGVGGALDITPTPAPDANAEPGFQVAWAGEMTVTYANHDNYSIILAHQRGANSPPPIGYGNDGVPDTHIPIGGQQVLRFPGGYHGAAFINLDAPGYVLTGQDESLIEHSFADQGNGYPVGDMDISYVNGFSRAASCVCVENSITAGCSTELWALHHCPDDNGVGSCKNPKRFDDFATSATEFFQPCTYHGGAFTYPRADANTLNYRCPSENYYCCIGHGDECARLNGNPRRR